jgi:hypothetical protein
MSTIKVDTITTLDGTGDITVSRPLSGSGASLTNLPAANLTGTLPALSGASLTNLPAANLTGTLPALSGASLTSLSAGNLTGTVADARISALTASKLTGALPAISGASLTNLPGGGKVLQVVQATSGTQQSSTSTTQVQVVTVNLTSTASDSDILVMYTSEHNKVSAGSTAIEVFLHCSSTAIGVTRHGGYSSLTYTDFRFPSTAQYLFPASVHSGGTVTCAVKFTRSTGSGSGTAYMCHEGGLTIITVLEIGA